MSVRDSFVAWFGEGTAKGIEAIAAEHAAEEPGCYDRHGSDEFRWVLMVCIAHDCLVRWNESHAVGVPAGKLQEWARGAAGMDEYDGDLDWIGLMAGKVDPWIPGDESALMVHVRRITMEGPEAFDRAHASFTAQLMSLVTSGAMSPADLIKTMTELLSTLEGLGISGETCDDEEKPLT